MFRLLLLLSLLGFFASCNKDRVFEQFYPIKNVSWNFHDTATFEVPIEDTGSYYHWLVIIRHNTGYRFSNAYIMAEVSGPNGFSWQQPVDVVIAEPDGRWIGKRSGSLVEVVQAMRLRTVMPHQGIYTFKISQFMRMNDAPGITDVGIQVLKAEKVY